MNRNAWSIAIGVAIVLLVAILGILLLRATAGRFKAPQARSPLPAIPSAPPLPERPHLPPAPVPSPR